MRQTETGTDYAVASESVAIDALDSQFKLARDVAAGEAIFISLKVCVFVCCIVCVFVYLCETVYVCVVW
jgi:glutamine phosphoribosylpyrophosphate amidotransferase